MISFGIYYRSRSANFLAVAGLVNYKNERWATEMSLMNASHTVYKFSNQLYLRLNRRVRIRIWERDTGTPRRYYCSSIFCVQFFSLLSCNESGRKVY